MQRSIKIFLGLLASCAVVFLFYYLQLMSFSTTLFHSEATVIRAPTIQIEVKNVSVTKEKVVFFKTHKTGGSSLQNLFMRYAHEHSLIMILPRFFNYIGHPQLFQEEFVIKLKDGYKYSIFAHHTRYNYKGFLSVFNPDDVIGENPTFITVLREPVALFESLYAYYECERLFGMSIEDFAESNSSTLHLFNSREAFRIGRNQMSFDLGVNDFNFEDSHIIRKKAIELDQQFDLVMVAERMEESLVLMKNLLNWSTDEVVIFHHNARPDHAKKNLTEHQKKGILRWNSADKILYDYFVVRFQQRVDKFGKDKMTAELAELRQRTSAWYDFCVSSESSNKTLDNDLQPFSDLVKGFQIKNSDNQTCVDLTKAELPFTDYMRELQRHYWKQNKY